jgi:predicted nucleotidyltransferase
MDIEIKKTVKAGNSSAVILPRAWLNKEVRVELVKKNSEIILQDIINISKKYISQEKIIGIYLVGSYARKEENENSDIDILIISDDIDKEPIHEGIYSILIISWDLLEWKLKNSLFPVGPMIKEAIPLINSTYLNIIKEQVIVTKKNVKWYMDTTEEKVGLIRKLLKSKKKKIGNRAAYTLVLRIRTLQLIEKLIKNQKYSKETLIRLIGVVAGSNNAYNAYLAVKNNEERADMTTKEEAIQLCHYLEKQLNDVRHLLKY